jgi:hypothetical protein
MKNQNLKITSILDTPFDDDEISRIVADELVVIHPRVDEPDDWYEDMYKEEGIMRVITTPNIGGDTNSYSCRLIAHYVEEELSMNEWLDDNIQTFIDRHSDTIENIDVGCMEATHDFEFKNTNLTEDQLNQIFDDFVEFLRGISPCDVVADYE